MRRFWRDWLSKNEEFSPWVGLSFGALYLLAVSAVGGTALYMQRAELTRQHLSDMRPWTAVLARQIGPAQDSVSEKVKSELRRAARESGVRFCALVRSGKFVAHSDASLSGHAAPKVAWRDADTDAIRSGVDPDQSGVNVLATPLNAIPTPGPTLELWVGLEPLPYVWKHSDMFVWSGYVLLAVLGLYLLVYRLFRRAVQPLEVIRRRLTRSSQPIGERLLALRLNDSFDDISRSWNELIEFVGQMQEQLRKSRLATDVTAAMDGFRSDRLTRILMQIPFGVIVVDADGAISFANRVMTAKRSKVKTRKPCSMTSCKQRCWRPRRLRAEPCSRAAGWITPSSDLTAPSRCASGLRRPTSDRPRIFSSFRM
jgi:hypothetical protein